MKDSLVLHNSGVSGGNPQAAGTIAFHRKKFGQDGAYHYFLEKTERVEQFHEDDFVAFHAGNWQMNLRSIGICLAGNFTMEQPTAFQIDAMTRLIMDLQARHGVPDSRIFLHKEVRDSPTSCPGTDLRKLFFEHRDSILRRKVLVIQSALARANGPRQSRLQRALVRLLKFFT